MEKVLELGRFRIKASLIKDKKGRKGYFIAESDLKEKSKVRLTPSKSRKKSDAVSPVEKSLTELRQYVDGKLTVRTIDEFLKTL
jgi:hypothetical protein